MTISRRITAIVLSLTLILSMMPLMGTNFYSYAEEASTGIEVDSNTINFALGVWEWTRPTLESGGYADYYEVTLYHGKNVGSGQLIKSANGTFVISEKLAVAIWDTSSVAYQDEEYYYISIRAAANEDDALGYVVYSEPKQYKQSGLKSPTNLAWTDDTKANWVNDASNPANTVSVVTLYKRMSATQTELVEEKTVNHAATNCDFASYMEKHNTYYFTVRFHSDASEAGEAKDSAVVTSSDNQYQLLVVTAPSVNYIEGYGFKWNKVKSAAGYTLGVYQEASLIKEISFSTNDTEIRLEDSRLVDTLVDGQEYTIKMKSLGDGYTSTDSSEPSSKTITYKKPTFYDNASIGKLKISDLTCKKIVQTLESIGENVGGEAVYSNADNTLTLKNFTYNGAGGKTRNRDAAISLPDNSTIKLSGTNSINCTASDGAGIVGSVKLTGNGKLSVTAKYCGFTSSVDIAGPTIVINADKYGFGSTDGTLTMSSGELTVITTEVSGRAVHPNMKANINQSLVYTAGLSASENRVRELPAQNGKFDSYSYMHISSASGLAAAVVTLDKSSFVYNDSAQVPEVTVKINGTKLKEDKDYSLSYYSDSSCLIEIKASDMEDAGTYYIRINGKGKYAGFIVKSFVITKRNPKVTNGSTYIYNGQNRTGNVVFKGALGKVLLNAKTDGTLPGTYTIEFVGDNNYNSAKGTWKIAVKTTSITKLSKGKKSFTVKVKKQSENYVSGYQVRYSKKSKMTNYSVQTIGSKYNTVSKKVKKLKAKTKYYVQVRTYKDIDGVRYYSSWSDKKSVKTK